MVGLVDKGLIFLDKHQIFYLVNRYIFVKSAHLPLKLTYLFCEVLIALIVAIVDKFLNNLSLFFNDSLPHLNFITH